MRRINQCFNTRLLELCKRTMQLEDLNTKLHALLPNTLKDHCHVGSFNGGCLVIITNSATWASQVRYLVPELRDQFRINAGIYQLTSIKVAVALIDTNIPSRKTSSASISTKARADIIKAGEDCRYEPLKEALLQLGSGGPTDLKSRS